MARTPTNSKGEIVDHPFLRTLGPGPYRFAGVGQIIFGESFGHKYIGPELEQGAGTCSHCSHAILEIYAVKAGDGKNYGVGSSCINKLYDEGVIDLATLNEAQKAKRLQDKKKRDARNEKAREAARLKRVAAREQVLSMDLAHLRSQPHPNEYFASQGKTLEDYVLFLLQPGGNALKALELATKAATND